MSANAPAIARSTVVAWRNAVFAVFAINGLAIATWMSRVPAVRDALGATTAEMGWVVFSIAVGSIAGLTSASHVLAWAGSRRTITGAMVAAALGLTVIGLGSTLSLHGAVVVAGLAVLGAGMGCCDVAMNVEGAAAERAVGRTVMPLFHAAFSVGTIAGAGLGALAEWSGLSTAAHFGAVGVAVVVSIGVSVRYLRLDAQGGSVAPGPPGEADHLGWRERLGMWADKRTLLLGLIVLGMAFAEGSANDWLALAMVDGHGVSNWTGALVYGVFVSAMTVGRAGGVWFLDRYGRVPVLRGSTVLATAGLLIVIFAPWAGLATVGVVLWGLGAALGFPVGMSAAADDSRTATARVSVVATIGYFAFLVGPPVIGFLGDATGLLRALLLVLVLVVLAGFATPAARERAAA